MAHLTYEQRYQIDVEKANGRTQEEIALLIGASQSTISREISRNHSEDEYNGNQAHKKALERRQNASRVPRKNMSNTIPLVKSMLCEYQFSPEQISGRLRTAHNILISHEWIYQHIWLDKERGGDLYKNLRRYGRKYNKRGSKMAGRGLIPERVGIEERPAIVDLKERVGDFEGDTIIGRHHRGAILTLVDRRTKLTRLFLLPGARSKETAQAMIQLLTPIKELVHTITTDNGGEFSSHRLVSAALGIKFFFARPYHSWERGLNENTNGLIRQYFPKRTNLLKLNPLDVIEVEHKLNNRPRKSLEYRTPNEEFLRLTRLDPHYAFRT